MKRVLIASAFAVLVWTAAGSPSAVNEIAPGVWVRAGDRSRNQPANSGWIIFKDYVLVIDANFPWGAREILAGIRKTTDKPIRFVFNTHYHGDHAFGGSVFTDQGATVVCSQECAAESRGKGQAGWDRGNAAGEYSLKPYRLAHPALTFEKSMAFDDGSRRVELHLMGPGHSKGDAIAWLPKEKILFTGDLCVNWRHGNNAGDPDADHDNWQRALDRMAAMTPAMVVVGHGDPGDVNVLIKQKEYLFDLVSQVRAGMAAGKPVDQLVSEIDLSNHRIAPDKETSAGAIRAVHRKLALRP